MAGITIPSEAGDALNSLSTQDVLVTAELNEELAEKVSELSAEQLDAEKDDKDELQICS